MAILQQHLMSTTIKMSSFKTKHDGLGWSGMLWPGQCLALVQKQGDRTFLLLLFVVRTTCGQAVGIPTY